jgi:hypothetical protein
MSSRGRGEINYFLIAPGTGGSEAGVKSSIEIGDKKGN